MKKRIINQKFWLIILLGLALLTGVNLIIQGQIRKADERAKKQAQEQRDNELIAFAQNPKQTLSSIVKLAQDKISAGDIIDGITLLKEAIARDPNQRDVFLILAQAYLLNNQPKLAVAAATRAEEIDPVSSKVLEILIQTQKAMNDNDSAQKSEARLEELKRMGL